MITNRLFCALKPQKHWVFVMNKIEFRPLMWFKSQSISLENIRNSIYTKRKINVSRQKMRIESYWKNHAQAHNSWFPLQFSAKRIKVNWIFEETLFHYQDCFRNWFKNPETVWIDASKTWWYTFEFGILQTSIAYIQDQCQQI